MSYETVQDWVKSTVALLTGSDDFIVEKTVRPRKDGAVSVVFTVRLPQKHAGAVYGAKRETLFSIISLLRKVSGRLKTQIKINIQVIDEEQ